MCRDPSLVLIYCLCGVENYLVVSIEVVHEAFEEWKLVCPTPITRYCRLTIRMEVFWPLKDISLNDELVVTMFDRGDLTMYMVNNLVTKQISCRDDSLLDGL
jgi:hypothetical protein